MPARWPWQWQRRCVAFGTAVAWVAVVFGGASMLVGCGTGKAGDADDRLSPDRLTAQAARDRLVEALPNVSRYAFYANVTPTYLHLSRGALDAQTVYESAQENRHGLVSTMFSDLTLAYYLTSFNEFRVGEMGEEWPDEHIPGPTAPMTIRPTVMVGTLVLFAENGALLALPIYTDRRKTALYAVFEGYMGDQAFYRIGDTARSFLALGSRPFPGR